MKKDTKARTFYLIILLLMIAHFSYYLFYLDLPLPNMLLWIGAWPILLLSYATSEPKKIRNPPYERILSLAAIPIAFCSLGLYFSYFLNILDYDPSSFFFFLISFAIVGYSIFLGWYKNGW